MYLYFMFISTGSDTRSHLDQNLLHLAVCNYDKDTVEVLLKYGAKVYIIRNTYESLIDMLCMLKHSNI